MDRPARLLAIVVLAAPAAAQGGGLHRTLSDPRRMIPADAWTSSEDIEAGDVDGDGDQDLFIPQSNAERLLRNAGAGILVEWGPPLPLAAWDTTCADLGDIDGDGDLDLYLGSLSTGETVLENTGGGAFQTWTGTYPLAPQASRALVLADMDGDGDLDVVVASFSGSSPNRFYRRVAGGFVDETSLLPPVQVGGADLATGDFDGDGDADIYFAYTGIGALQKQDRLFLNQGASFSDATGLLPVELGDTYAVATADLDLDGDLDVYLGNAGSAGQDALLLGTGSGFVDATAQLPAVADSTTSVALGDVDADGDPDAVIGNGFFAASAIGEQNRLYRNDGTAHFSDATASLPQSQDLTLALALADFDQDQDLDVYGLNTYQDAYWLNDGAGHFTDATSSSPPLVQDGWGLDLGDVDGDGDADALVPRREHPVVLLRNLGSGSFVPVAGALPVTTVQAFSAALGDVDGDGDRDAWIAAAGQDLLWRNDGAGTFTAAPGAIPADSSNTLTVELGDLDGDGDLDAMPGNNGEETPWINQGGGTFAFGPILAPVGFSVTRNLELADLDADGDLDLFLANGNQFPAPNGVYRNNGTAQFTLVAGGLPSHSEPSTGLDLADVDGDGDLDAYVGNFNVKDRLYKNDGSAVFSDASALLPSHVDATTAVVLADFDLDGDFDAYLGSQSLGADKLYLGTGDGSGALVDASDQLEQVYDQVYGVASADLDGNGSVDVFTAALASSRPIFSLRRSLHWQRVPSVGKALPLEIHGGGAAGPWLLAYSSGTAEIPLPPFGILKLHPAALFFAGSGALEASGGAVKVIAVPADPGLVGVTLFWQAAAGASFALTNRESTAFTAL